MFDGTFEALFRNDPESNSAINRPETAIYRHVFARCDARGAASRNYPLQAPFRVDPKKKAVDPVRRALRALLRQAFLASS